MTSWGWFAASLAALLIPVSPQIGPPPGNGPDVHLASADAGAPALEALAADRLSKWPPQIPGIAEPLAMRALALPSAAALAGLPDALAAFAKALFFWPVAVFAGLAAWLVRLRPARWSRIAAGAAAPDHASGECEPDPAPPSAQPLPPETVAPDPRAPAQGADVAARARFVAMTFAFPETSPSREGPTSWPLHINCRPTRFTLSLQQAALNYRLEFCNRGAEALGPLIIRADLVAAESRIAPSHLVDLAGDAMPLCHYLDHLATADSLELAGEIRLPLASVAAMRLGTAELLVPVLRLCAESAGDARPKLTVSVCFAIGIPPLSAGGGIQPFRLDAGPGIWRKLCARRLIVASLS